MFIGEINLQFPFVCPERFTMKVTTREAPQRYPVYGRLTIKFREKSVATNIYPSPLIS